MSKHAARTDDELPGPARLAALIDRRGHERGHHAFVEDARSQRRVTYADLAGAAARWATLLDRQVVAPGAAVLIDIDDPVAFTVAYLGVLAAGRCSVPVDPDAPPAELARTTRATRPAMAVTDRADRSLKLPTVLVDPATCLPAAEPAAARAAGGRGPGAVRLSTSGSTGEPKIVELDEARLLHVARAVAAHNRLGPEDRGYNPLPLFHVNAEVVAVLATLVAGATMVLDRRFHRRGFWRLLREREITWLNAVPAILTILVGEASPGALPRLRFIRSASAPLQPSVRQRIEDMLAVPVMESYGMTEAASQITATPLDGGAPAGSAGRPVAVALQVRRPDGIASAPGEVGRVWIRGAGVITGYVGGRGSERFDSHGWLDTGDLGHLDHDGYLYVAGRADDVINRGGEMVYPREVEEVLLTHPRVLEAVVVGQPHDVLGAVPVAYVLARPGSDATLVDELEALCTEQLSRFKRPAAVYIVADLPRAATGKIRRRELVLNAGPGT
jgi:oxalate---CoA ligase